MNISKKELTTAMWGSIICGTIYNVNNDLIMAKVWFGLALIIAIIRTFSKK